MDLNIKDWRSWTGFIWLRRGTGGELLCTQELTIRMCEMQETSWLAEKLLASPKRLLDTVR